VNISARFTEFGMTGAFFWIAQLIYLALTHDDVILQAMPHWQAFFDQYQELGESLPPALSETAGSLLTAFGLIGIFVTGLILNLLGSYFFAFENIFFARHLARNADWMSGMMRGCTGAVQEDYRLIRQQFGAGLFVALPQVWHRLRLSPACKRVQSFLFAFIHVFGDNGTPELLSDQVHLWRTARALGITFWFLSVEMLVLGHQDSTSVQLAWAALLFLLGIYTTLRSYNRMCHTLFTMACATFNRQQHP